MIVKVIDYGQGEVNFVEYLVSDLSCEQLNYLNDNLEEKTRIEGNDLIITMNFDDELYPFGSEVAKFRLDDFISREEIEMNIFLSSFLEDM
ncbi:MAG: hypothetical protein IJ672_02625 [Methanobrevibacter sp.]|uniref:DUF5750 family protein n=1 Tax=Methanobrevibacter sp. TaxID=66852 RepID=UPI0025FD1412|nr:DUF5750 family protein [Methanobrevibacter sp.]MBQ8016769.1 hypothetical protein [Methanobrevibacter sp.]MBR1610370.1 hypothetical protein [Methanobrevibacter sp.]